MTSQNMGPPSPITGSVSLLAQMCQFLSILVSVERMENLAGDESGNENNGEEENGSGIPRHAHLVQRRKQSICAF